MNFALAEMPLPLRFRPETPMSDAELMRFCAANDVSACRTRCQWRDSRDDARRQQDREMNSRITRLLDEWAEMDRSRLSSSTPMAASPCPMAPCAPPMPLGSRAARWDALTDAEQSRYAPYARTSSSNSAPQTDSLAELQPKMEQWITNGAKLAWLIDPENRTISIYRPDEQPEILLILLRFRETAWWQGLSW